MHVWQEAAAAFGLCSTIKRKKDIYIYGVHLMTFAIVTDIYRLNEAF